jgi:hypothetical protein
MVAITFAVWRKLSLTPGDAKKLAAEMHALFKAIVELVQGLDHLPNTVKRSINLSSISKDELFKLVRAGVDNPPDLIEKFRNGLLSIAPGIEATHSRLEREAGPVKKGRRRNEAAYAVSQTIANVFVIGFGSIPTLGRRADSEGLSGQYGRTVEDVFRYLGIRVSDAYDPCKCAVEKLNGEYLELLLMLRCPVTRPLVEISLGVVEMPTHR